MATNEMIQLYRGRLNEIDGKRHRSGVIASVTMADYASLQISVLIDVLEELSNHEGRLERIEAQTFSTADIAQAWWMNR